MIRHILKIIWSEKRMNIWLLVEQVLVFSILWFLLEQVAEMVSSVLKPKGFDIENCYRVELGRKDIDVEMDIDWDPGDNEEELDEDGRQMLTELSENLWTIYDRIKAYPEVERVCIGYYATPYSGSYLGAGYMVDTVSGYAQDKFVTPDFFDVFRIKITQGRNFAEDEAAAGTTVIISPDAAGTFLKYPIAEISALKGKKSNSTYRVVGVTEPCKRYEYAQFGSVVYKPMGRNYLGAAVDPEICFRVKHGVRKGFEDRFIKEMSPGLEVGPYYLFGLTSLEYLREDMLEWTGYTNLYRIVFSFSLFLLVNIFLGIIGTFWFRIEVRRAEVGLRQAIGSSKKAIKRLLITESLLLLFVASIMASIITINLAESGIAHDLWQIVSRRAAYRVSGDVWHYAGMYLLTFVCMGIINVLAVWYPARQASEVQPIEVLHEE